MFPYHLVTLRSERSEGSFSGMGHEDTIVDLQAGGKAIQTAIKTTKSMLI